MIDMAEACAERRGLVYHIAKQYQAVCLYDRAADTEDLVQAGYIGLMRAVQTYDESKGIFSSWAVVYIRLEMRKVLGISRRIQRADSNAASLDEVVPGTEDSTLLDTLEAPVDIEGDYDHAELVAGVRNAINKLSAPESTLVWMHDLQGQELAAIGNRCWSICRHRLQNAPERVETVTQGSALAGTGKGALSGQTDELASPCERETIQKHLDEQYGVARILAGTAGVKLSNDLTHDGIKPMS